jgi:hypothetical protein
MRKCLRSVVLALVLLSGLPRPAQAQIGFESLLGGVNNFSFFFSCWKARGGVQTRRDCPSEKNGYGIEVSYLVAKIPVKGGNMREIPSRMQLTGMSAQCSKSGCDSTKTYLFVPAKKVPAKYVGLELALGYSQFSG